MRNGRSPTDVRVQTLVCNTGLDESAGGKAGAFYNVENMRVSPPGGTLRKRTGYEAIAPIPSVIENAYSSPFVPGGRRAIGLGEGNVAVLDDGTAYAVSDHYERVGAVSSVEPFSQSCVHWEARKEPGYPPSVCVLANGVEVVAIKSYDSSTIYARLLDGTVQSVSLSSSSAKIVAIPSGNQACLWHWSGGNILLSLLAPPYTTATSTAIVTAVRSDVSWDATLADAGNKIGTTPLHIVAFQPSATSVTVLVFSGATVESTASIAVASGTYAISVRSIGSRIWVGLYNLLTRTTSCAWVDIVGDVSLAQTAIGADTGSLGPAGPPLFGPDTQSGYSGVCYVYRNLTYNGSVVTITGVVLNDGTEEFPAKKLYGAVPISKPDNGGRVWLAHVASTTMPQTVMRYQLVQYRSHQFQVATELASEQMPNVPSMFNPAPFSGFSWFTEPAVTASLIEFPLCFPTSSSGRVPSVETRVVAYRKPRTVAVAANVVSGQPIDLNENHKGWHRSAELGWPGRPEFVTGIFSGIASSSLVAGVYTYRAVWEYVDALGRRHLSAPSDPKTLVVPTGGMFTLHWTPPVAMTRNNDDARIRLYRTQGAGGVQSTQYQLAASSGPITNSAYIDVVDSSGDAAIADQEFLYTDGGVKPNALAPACRYLVRGETRLWCGGLLDPRLIQASREFVPTEPINFVDDDAWRVLLPAPCTGLAYLDGTLVAFTASAVYLVTGQGPDDRGVGSFDTPRAYVDGVGCHEPNSRSIVTTSVGVIFLSTNGFKLIPRGFGPIQSISDPVSDTLSDSGAYCVSSAAGETAAGAEARFLMAPSASASTGINQILAYEIGTGRWYRDTLPYNAGVLGVWNEGFVHSVATLLQSGIHYGYQRGASATEGASGVMVPAKLQTAWQHPFGVGGHGRVGRLLLATEGSPVRIRATIETDEGHTQVATLDFASERVPYNYREIMLEHPALGAYRLTLEEQAFSGANLAFGAVAITAECDDSDALRPSDEGERA